MTADGLYQAVSRREVNPPSALTPLRRRDGDGTGLSWSTILRKREAYRRAFSGFDPEKIARYADADMLRLLADPGIVRNRLKVKGAVRNARATLALVEERGSLSDFLWFVGPTICYAFMQATGMVNDHLADCFRHP
ncbi:MAG TPA: DNA-3-methyladenine glycosylase I [Candidatus Deferrimicrobiaceae bacterium]|jgi:DNA-3-methyladenine glycosylase I